MQCFRKAVEDWHISCREAEADSSPVVSVFQARAEAGKVARACRRWAHALGALASFLLPPAIFPASVRAWNTVFGVFRPRFKQSNTETTGDESEADVESLACEVATVVIYGCVNKAKSNDIQKLCRASTLVVKVSANDKIIKIIIPLRIHYKKYILKMNCQVLLWIHYNDHMQLWFGQTFLYLLLLPPPWKTG